MGEADVPARRPRRIVSADDATQFSHGRWTINEHEQYLKAEWRAHPLSWTDVSRRVGTRSPEQCISHDQKFKRKVYRALREGYDGAGVAQYAEHRLPSMDAIVARLGETALCELLPAATIANLFGAEGSTVGVVISVKDNAVETDDKAAREPTPPSLLLESGAVEHTAARDESNSVESVGSCVADVAWSVDGETADDLDLSSLLEAPMESFMLEEDEVSL